jgi:hypothetical protein
MAQHKIGDLVQYRCFQCGACVELPVVRIEEHGDWYFVYTTCECGREQESLFYTDKSWEESRKQFAAQYGVSVDEYVEMGRELAALHLPPPPTENFDAGHEG